MSKFKSFLNVLRTEKLRAREDLLSFIKCVKGDYRAEWFHKVICDSMNDFTFSEVAEYYMLFMPPQNGKSEISSRNLPAFLLGRNPKLKIAVISYNDNIAKGFGNDIKRIMESAEYKSIFPDTVIGEPGLRKNSNIMETSAGGYVINVGVGGALTSKTVDIFIFDDLYKGPMDAWSPVYRERVWNFYNTVAETRGHKNEKMLILYTRWHEDDLAGRLLEENKDKWNVNLFQGIKTNEFNHELDPRNSNEILWPERHSYDKYMELKKRDEIAFEALFQQNPKPQKGLMYPNHKTYTSLEGVQGVNKCYIDTADSGSDYLSAIFYIESGTFNYITDIYFTKDNMETTYKEISRRLIQNNTRECIIEGNNGGNFFATQVKRELLDNGGRCRIDTFHQANNKISRIYTNSSSVCDYIMFPLDWKSRYNEAYRSFTRYRKEGGNDHDDLQDALTGTIERNRNIVNVFERIKITRPRGV